MLDDLPGRREAAGVIFFCGEAYTASTSEA
jgi:hypothetical protein